MSTTESQVAVGNLQEILCSCTWGQSFLLESLLGHADYSLHTSTTAIPAQPQTTRDDGSHLTLLAPEHQHWMLCVALSAPAPKGTNLGYFNQETHLL